MLRRRLSSVGWLPLVVTGLTLVAIVIGAILGRRSLEQTTSAGRWEGLLAFALLCALISFAVLEMGKRLLPIRALIQRHYFRQWWNYRAELVDTSADVSWNQLIEAMNVGVVETGVLMRRSPGTTPSSSSVFGLPIQLLAAQVSNAVDLALTEPSGRIELYYTLTWSMSNTSQLRSALSQFLNSVGEDARSAPEYLIAPIRKYLDHHGSLEEVYYSLRRFRRVSEITNIEVPFDPFFGTLTGLLEPPQTADDPRSFRASQGAPSYARRPTGRGRRTLAKIGSGNSGTGGCRSWTTYPADTVS